MIQIESANSNDTHEVVPSTTFIFKDVVSKSIPAICGLLFVFILETINIIMVGQLNDPNIINGIGIGTLYCNFTGYVIGLGLVGALDTRCSQCFGNGAYKSMGVFTNTTRVFVSLVFVFFCVPLSFLSSYVLEAIGQSEQVTYQARTYIITLLPALFFSLHFNIQVRYLQSMKSFYPGMVITLITFLLHPFWSYLAVLQLDMGVFGAGLAFSLTQFLNLLIISIYIHYYNPCPESYFFITADSISLSQILDFASLAVPSALLFCADWIGFEILTLLSSYLDPLSLAANICFFNFCSIIFMVALGLSYSSAALVGNYFGALKIKTAKAYALNCIMLGFLIYIVVCTLLYVFIESIPALYTQNLIVREKLIEIIFLYLKFALVDCFQIVGHGIIKGIGKQEVASYIVLIVLFPFNIPLCYFLAFKLELGLMGLWYSQYTSISIIAISFFFILSTTDWRKLAEKTVLHIQKREDALNLKNN